MPGNNCGIPGSSILRAICQVKLGKWLQARYNYFEEKKSILCKRHFSEQILICWTYVILFQCASKLLFYGQNLKKSREKHSNFHEILSMTLKM